VLSDRLEVEFIQRLVNALLTVIVKLKTGLLQVMEHDTKAATLEGKGM